MMNLKMIKRSLYAIFSTLALVLTFQNCSGNRVQFKNSSQGVITSASTSQAISCEFNGSEVKNGESRFAFLNSTVKYGETCLSEVRVCTEGKLLSGSYNYSSCAVEAEASCLFNGQTVNGSSTIDAFQNPSALSPETCISEKRRCDNGSLSGSFNFSKCVVNQPASCLFNGVTVAHNQTINAYSTSQVAFGKTCEAQIEQRTCTNGSLSGSFKFSSCTVDRPASCLFNGQTLAHGQTVNAYSTSQVEFGQTCDSKLEQRICTDGTLSGSFKFANCNVDKPASCLFDGRTLAHGEKVTAFNVSQVPFGNTCDSQQRICSNGTLSGSFTNGSCTVASPANCTLGTQSINHGSQITAYSAIVSGVGKLCSSLSEVRTCTNGLLSGSMTNLTCANDKGSACEGGLYLPTKNMCQKTVDEVIAVTSNTVTNSSCNDHYGYARFVPVAGSNRIQFWFDNFSPSNSPGWNCPYATKNMGDLSLKANDGTAILFNNNTTILDVNFTYSTSGNGCSPTSGTAKMIKTYLSLCSSYGAQYPSISVTVNGNINVRNPNALVALSCPSGQVISGDRCLELVK